MISPIDEIKTRLDIVEVIGSYVKLQKCGANFRARCPFHSEKKPSFFVSPARQIWHCFGCGKGSSIFDFVKEIERVEFGDALRILAQKAGVELKPIRPELRTARQRLSEICELACKFFEKQLEANKSGQEAKKYLLKRGITEDSIKKWKLGYAPDAWRGLSDFLVEKGYQIEEIVKAGLAIKKEEIPDSRLQTSDSSFYDRFRSRIIFPIFDLNSQPVGFGGRIFGPREKQEIAKYVNSPSTLLYDKSRILYGLDKAKIEIRKQNLAILVEGYTDCIMAHQAGTENTVATSGTALTPYQLKILKRYSDNLITAFDMDVAGDTATKRGIDLAQSLDFNIKVITMSQKKDPADVIAQSPQLWERLIGQSCSILDFYFETTFSKFDKKTPDGKREISKILLPIIKRIPNKILVSHWLQKLAKELEIKVEALEEELKKIKLEAGFLKDFEPKIVSSSKSRKERLEEALMSLIFQKPEFHKLITENDLSFMDKRTAVLISKFKELFPRKEDSDNFQTKFSDFQKNFINPLILKTEIEEESSEIDSGQEFQLCLEEIRSFGIKNKLEQISQQIKRAEEAKDSPKTDHLIKAFNELTKRLITK